MYEIQHHFSDSQIEGHYATTCRPVDLAYSQFVTAHAIHTLSACLSLQLQVVLVSGLKQHQADSSIFHQTTLPSTQQKTIQLVYPGSKSIQTAQAEV